MKTSDRERTENLFAVIADLHVISDIKRFLADLLTESELIEFGKRFRAAEMIDSGALYVDIVKETGLSSTTVARVSRWLHAGEGGYRLVFERRKNRG